jgi:hypothetical protein
MVTAQERIGICFWCGERCDKWFSIGEVLGQAPFCGYGHAHAWRKAQRAPGKVTQIGGPR